jgi:hypothetical protein
MGAIKDFALGGDGWPKSPVKVETVVVRHQRLPSSVIELGAHNEHVKLVENDLDAPLDP